MSIQDLSSLPAPSLLEEISYETILSEMVDRLVSVNPEFSALVESDPAYQVLEVAAYFRMLDRQRVNEAALATLLPYASNTDLDNIGARYDVARLVISPADSSTVPPTEAELEPDTDFRRRILLALEGISVAGPTNAYYFHALSADPLIADVSATSPNPGEVLVTILSRNDNGEASQELIEIVLNALNAEDVRPLTDEVIVQSVKLVEYSVDATIYVDDSPESEPIVEEALVSLDRYINGQFRLGRSIRRSAIMASLHVTGVQNVVLTEPQEDILISKEQAGHCVQIVVSSGDLDE
ncbi:baseplate J/gp47 family protein [Vibrio olivae]|uniref:Baseplate J/gp47 family protein n=1 Tax=Vibrio olivae TaxID=1243002 RepID=A0ABV5HR42_9VIBR